MYGKILFIVSCLFGGLLLVGLVFAQQNRKCVFGWLYDFDDSIDMNARKVDQVHMSMIGDANYGSVEATI